MRSIQYSSLMMMEVSAVYDYWNLLSTVVNLGVQHKISVHVLAWTQRTFVV